MSVIIAIFVVFIILCVSELGWRKHWLSGEFGRKFVHISVGSFVAFWPFFLSWTEIRWLSLAFLVVVSLSHYFKVFHAINSVQRPTYGEVFFALTVGLLTLVTHNKAIYATAILQMSLADGLAAVIGTHYGRENKYHLLGHTKSVAGTAAFFVVSLAILIGYAMWSASGLSVTIVVFGALMAAALENIASFGLDNILVPLFIAFLLVQL